jgi:hypothetical protein
MRMMITPEMLVIWITINLAAAIFGWMFIQHRVEGSHRPGQRSGPAAINFEQMQNEDTRRPYTKKGRRPYPKVLPKFRNPGNSAETWCGRGKQPRWLTAQLAAGRNIEEFRISSSTAQPRHWVSSPTLSPENPGTA